LPLHTSIPKLFYVALLAKFALHPTTKLEIQPINNTSKIFQEQQQKVKSNMIKTTT
jgi:hypothetical protein